MKGELNVSKESWSWVLVAVFEVAFVAALAGPWAASMARMVLP
jgi:hypothetical protein